MQEISDSTVNRANNFFGQVLVTDTDADRVQTIFKNSDLECKVFEVNHGEVCELKEINVA